jgi:hypothetical protein
VGHASEIDFELTADALAVTDRWTYVWGAHRRPFVHPLLSPDGSVLTVDAPDDHPWHHGLWFTIKFVNGENFWEEYDEYGVLRHERPPVVDEEDDRLEVRGSLQWVRPDRSTVVIDEHRALTHHELGAGVYRIDLDTSLVPRVDVELDRTPFTTWGGYGGLTLRGAPDWRETRLQVSDGSSHQQIHGVTGRWCDLSGVTDAGPAGVAMFDHPDNPRHPTPWYASTRADTYGEGWANFMNAALLWDAPLTVSAGESLRVRHGVLVHRGLAPRDIEAAYEAYLS